jgi:hypothetical protein
MIEYLGIQDNGKLIEHYTTGVMRPNDINEMINKLANQKSSSKVIQQLKSNQHNVYYFTQGTYLFLLATREEKVRYC